MLVRRGKSVRAHAKRRTACAARRGPTARQGRAGTRAHCRAGRRRAREGPGGAACRRPWRSSAAAAAGKRPACPEIRQDWAGRPRTGPWAGQRPFGLRPCRRRCAGARRRGRTRARLRGAPPTVAAWLNQQRKRCAPLRRLLGPARASHSAPRQRARRASGPAAQSPAPGGLAAGNQHQLRRRQLARLAHDPPPPPCEPRPARRPPRRLARPRSPASPLRFPVRAGRTGRAGARLPRGQGRQTKSRSRPDVMCRLRSRAAARCPWSGRARRPRSPRRPRGARTRSGRGTGPARGCGRPRSPARARAVCGSAPRRAFSRW
mmetsp:Transcript_18892/g.72016  ORF Transcript_18892/g.72016 Transcript_18892/m.72016 type:complete len:319 (+) Transcript_18892:708-1664(+)